MRFVAWVVVLLMAASAGCDGATDGEADGAGTPDGAVDPLDSGADAGDADPDAATDAAPPLDVAPLDRGAALLDVAVDRGSDADGYDAAVDGPPDAAPDAAHDAQPMVEADVVAYCDCMLLTCHDLYHRLWGEDEGVARARCFRVATDLPRAPEATEGDNLECRAHWCEVSFDLDDPELCGRAGGDDVCR